MERTGHASRLRSLRKRSAVNVGCCGKASNYNIKTSFSSVNPCRTLRTGALAMRSQEYEVLLATLRARFEAHPRRHPGLVWEEVERRLAGKPEALQTLAAMEESGGEPDVIDHDPTSGSVSFCDCAPESPAGRRSLCYDSAALDARKQAKPEGSAVDMAARMGVELLTEEQYRRLQT